MNKTFKLCMAVIVGVIAGACVCHAQQTETIYSWESPSGTVTETGGTIVQHNSLSFSRINYQSSGYHTIQLCGKKENISDENNNPDAVYFTITLANGKTFKAGDKIEITAMRNNDVGGKSSIHFVNSVGEFRTATAPVAWDDTNTWANLGKMHEVTFSGGTGAKALGGKPSELTGAGTEPVNNYSLYPSTNTFTVPEAADGSTTLTLTRNESECYLYITRIVVTSNNTSAIEQIQNSHPEPVEGEGRGEASYSLSGQRVSSAHKGIIISNGKKIVIK